MATQKEGEAIAVLQTRMDNVDKTLLRIEAKIDAQDKKYASKWVQQIVGGFVAIVLIAIVTALLALVIIPATHPKAQQATTSPTSGTTVSGGSTRDATANANSHSDSATPTDSQSASSGGVQVTIPKVQGVN